jgi:hypothetical protein
VVQHLGDLLQGGALGVVLAVDRLGTEDDQPGLRFVGHVAARGRRDVYAIEVAPARGEPPEARGDLV